MTVTYRLPQNVIYGATPISELDPRIIEDLRSKTSRPGGIEAIGFRALRCLAEHNVMSVQRTRLRGDVDRLRRKPYTNLVGVEKRRKLLLHLCSYAPYVVFEDYSVIMEITDEEICMHLRRVLDRLTGSKVYRFRTQEDPEPPKPLTLEERILDANNRFSPLLGNLQGHDAMTSPDYTCPMESIEPAGPDVRDLTLEDRQYIRAAEANQSRRKLGYKPKPGKYQHAEVGDETHRRLVNKVAVYDHFRSLKPRILKPLFKWREEWLRPYLADNSQGLSTLPLNLVEAYEHWYEEFLELPETQGLPVGLSPSIDPEAVPRIWDD